MSPVPWNGGHNLYGPALMPTVAATTIHTHQLMKADAFDQGCVRQKEAATVQAVLQIPLDALFHSPTVYLPVGNRLLGRSRAGNLQRWKTPAG